ncbi:MAG: TonB family protein [Woeseiaceae bacterium]
MTNNRWHLGLIVFSAAFVQAQEGNDVSQLLDPGGDRVPMQTVVPVFPEKALRDRVQGHVEVCFNVDREGRTFRIAVRTSTHRMFEKPAINAVRASSYQPLEQHQILSNIKTCRTFRFQLDPIAIEDPSESLVDTES